MINTVADGKQLYSFEAEFDVESLANARKLGLPDEWVRRFEKPQPAAPASAQRRSTGGGISRGYAARAGRSAARHRWQGGEPLPRSRARRTEAERRRDRVAGRCGEGAADADLGVERPRHRPRRDLGWSYAPGSASRNGGTARYRLRWSFRLFFFYGSPATHYGLYAGRRIKEVDGQTTADLDAFIKVVRGKPDRASLRLTTVSWNGQTDVITLKLDKHYWPAYELDRQSDGTWTRIALDPPESSTAGAVMRAGG